MLLCGSVAEINKKARKPMEMFASSVIVKGGWVMIPIIVGSIIAFALTIERGLLFWRIRLNVKKFADDVFVLLKQGEIQRVLGKCDLIIHPIGVVFKSGLENFSKDTKFIERVMEQKGNQEIAKLEKYMNVFIVIVGVEPMLGFLGTILGLINAFMAWEVHAATVTVDKLAAGIYQAMITTAGGLLVAIPFYLIYSFFSGKINSMIKDLNLYSEELLTILEDLKNKK